MLQGCGDTTQQGTPNSDHLRSNFNTTNTMATIAIACACYNSPLSTWLGVGHANQACYGYSSLTLMGLIVVDVDVH